MRTGAQQASPLGVLCLMIKSLGRAHVQALAALCEFLIWKFPVGAGPSQVTQTAPRYRITLRTVLQRDAVVGVEVRAVKVILYKRQYSV